MQEVHAYLQNNLLSINTALLNSFLYSYITMLPVKYLWWFLQNPQHTWPQQQRWPRKILNRWLLQTLVQDYGRSCNKLHLSTANITDYTREYYQSRWMSSNVHPLICWLYLWQNIPNYSLYSILNSWTTILHTE